MIEYKNKLEVLGDGFSDPENWVVYIDPENGRPSIAASMIKDEWIFQDFCGTGKEFIRFYVNGRFGRSAADPVNVTSMVRYHFDKYNLWS